MPVRLRYLAHDLEVPQGEFVIGRSAECQLSLDDPLVSRRHALLTVRVDGVAVEDLGSRNGVLVNGVKIEGQHQLSDGDMITIGGQEMVLAVPDSVRFRGSNPPSSPSARPRMDTMQRRPTLTNEPMARGDLRGDDLEEATHIGSSPFFDPATKHPDKRVNALVLIGGVADKALAMGKPEDAERLLQRSLNDILTKARAGDGISPELFEHAAGYAVRLAGGTGNGRWVDYIIELYAVNVTLMPQVVVDELYKVLRKVARIDLPVLRDYTEKLRAEAPGYGPAERFLLQRIEGLERLGALK
jgi:pSer/pThr/pTyr-binding forkhead associated (FHA) protein